MTTEAGSGDINLTARPRLIALPQSSAPVLQQPYPTAAPSMVRIATKRSNDIIISRSESLKSVTGDTEPRSLSTVSR